MSSDEIPEGEDEAPPEVIADWGAPGPAEGGWGPPPPMS